MKVAYLDCFSGISGDMTLGALIHLGVPVDYLKDQLATLALAGADLSMEIKQVSGITACDVTVSAEGDSPHRHLSDIVGIIQKSLLPATVKTRSVSIFKRLAEAEATVHGCDIEAVHFHEVGAVDALMDIVGASLGMAYLGVSRVVASPLPLGSGTVDCAHGRLPVPAPATAELLKGIPTYGGALAGERVTPTGAAIVREWADDYGSMPPMRIEAVGYGAGKRQDPGQPNLLRIVIGDADDPMAMLNQPLVLVETQIDDMNPEWYGYIMERLFEDGALDVVWIPVQAKKNRPGCLAQVLCEVDRRDAIVDRLLRETTTLGVRWHEVQRRSLARRLEQRSTSFGSIQVKQVTGMDGRERAVPEFDVCARIAREQNIPIREVYERIARDLADASEAS